jgi:imidazolonepropionase-like amidohydrolase
MTTLSAAQFLHREQDEGTVETGKLASLVLLRTNPLARIEACSDIHSVILRGRYLDQTALNALIPAKVSE